MRKDVVAYYCGLIKFNDSSSSVSFSGAWKENRFPNKLRDFDYNIKLIWQLKYKDQKWTLKGIQKLLKGMFS